MKERPDAAVVDYLLGDIAGLEVCKKVRENALTNGVDIVVLRSSDAAEIVNLVSKEISRKK